MTLRTSARLAGFMFLFYIVTGIAGMAVFAPVTRGKDTTAKLASVVRHERLARIEAAYSVVMLLNPILLGVALWGLTRRHDPELAMVALACRLTEGVFAPLGAVANVALLAAAKAAAEPAQAAAANALGSVLLSAQKATPLVAATCFAFGSTIFCWLFLRGRSIPAWLSWLGLVASLLLVIALPLQIAGLLEAPLTLWVWLPMLVFEVTCALWLLIKGVAEPANLLVEV